MEYSCLAKKGTGILLNISWWF